MKVPTGEHLDAVRRLLAYEAQGVTHVEERLAATVRVHQKMLTRLESVLGSAGARVLFARCVQLRTGDYPYLGRMSFEAKRPESLVQQLTVCLREEDPAAAIETGVALGATLLALLSTMIGERLTFQVLRSAWPAFDVGGN